METTSRSYLRGYDFSQYSKSFMFGLRDSSTIDLDLSLANLFQKLTVECSGILGNPQWKHYRHMELLKKDQIRLSNGIWRSWHIQFQKGRKPLFCQFVIDPEVDMQSHRYPQAVIIEGKYWKRTRQAVANEYRKWRLFYKKKHEWSDIRRMPSAAPSALILNGSSQQEGQTDSIGQAMQVDLVNINKIGGMFKGLEDFPESFFALPRPGDERSYMRPLVDSTEMMQPSLDMLNPTLDNPTLDEFLDRLEPMEIMFPPFIGSTQVNTPYQASLATPPQQPTANNPFFMSPSILESTQTQTNTTQYGNQTPFMSSPTKPMNISQEQQPMLTYPHQIDRGYSGGDRVYGLSPSAFLNPPQAQEVRVRTESDAMMEFGTPPTANYPLKAELNTRTDLSCSHSQFNPVTTPTQYEPATTPTTMYQQQQSSHPSTPTPSLFTQIPMESVVLNEGKVPSLLTQYLEEEKILPSQPHPPLNPSPEQTPPPMYSYSTPHQPLYRPQQPNGLESTFPTTPIQHHPPSLRKLSNEFTTSPEFNLPEKGSGQEEMFVDPNIHFIAEQMKRLEQQQLEQLREIEKQQDIATKQYLGLLQQYLSESTDQPSQQQQQNLTSVLSDPASVQILKTILIQGGETALTTNPPPVSVKKEAISPPQEPPTVGQGPKMPSSSSGSISKFISPAQLAKASGVSDFQSRLVMAAAAQACISSTGPLTSDLPSTNMPLETTAPRIKSPTSFETSEGRISPALLKKFKNARNLTPDEKKIYQELRRQSHITAEQKRRGSIKNGFDHLQSLVINPTQYPSGKVSKAVLLEKTIEHIQLKHNERDAKNGRIEELKGEIKRLNEAITQCQQQLPASGVPVTRQRFEENKQLFQDYVQQRTQQNYKFWIFSIILQHLFESYNSTVSMASSEALCQTVLNWFEQHCNLPALRPVVMSSLRELSVKTSILSDPSKVPEQLAQYATKT